MGIGVNIIGIRRHGFNMLSLIIPANSGFALALILVPIEFISYLAKPMSLGVRLFINFISFIHLVPMIILVVLMFLELAVACIQAYVFVTLVCIYLNDSINLH